MFVIYCQRAEGLRQVRWTGQRRNIAEVKLAEINRVVQSHATPEEPAFVWLESIPDEADPKTWIGDRLRNVVGCFESMAPNGLVRLDRRCPPLLCRFDRAFP